MSVSEEHFVQSWQKTTIWNVQEMTFGPVSPPNVAFSKVANGSLTTCGIDLEGYVICFGYDYYGQVSDVHQVVYLMTL